MNTALLTVDDVPSRNTPALVDYLTEKGIPAIFFVTGCPVDAFREEALYAIRHGIILGNHSLNHPAFSTLTMAECIAEIEGCEQVLDRLYREAGMPRLYRPFRFPYGDKGGDKDALQQFLRARGFDKVDDSHIPCPWWREYGLNQDVDTFWSFDFEEYRLFDDLAFTLSDIRRKMHDPAPAQGAALFGAGHRNILLMHDHDSTEAVLPRYYQVLLDELLANGVTFEEPRFIHPA